MAHINLLPWRATLRKERETRFAIHTVIALSITGLLFLGVYLYIDFLTENQRQLSNFLLQEIEQSKKKIEEIQDIRKKHEGLTKRIEIIHQLQTSRPEIVYIFNNFVKAVAGIDVFYKKIAQAEDKFTLDGVARSNAGVSSLMRKLDDSPVFEKPNLVIIQAVPASKEGGNKEIEFKMIVQQEKSKEEKEKLEREKVEKEKAEKAKAAAAAAAAPPAAASNAKKP